MRIHRIPPQEIIGLRRGILGNTSKSPRMTLNLSDAPGSHFPSRKTDTTISDITTDIHAPKSHVYFIIFSIFLQWQKNEEFLQEQTF